MSVLAIDYGKSKFGYAIGSLFVSESGTLRTSDIMSKVKNFQKIVLGLPLSMSGNYSTQTFEVIRFALKLKKMGKEVLLIDERMTTKMAKTFEKRDDDRFSAEQLLFEYIQNPHRAIEFRIIEVLEQKSISCNLAFFIEAPYCESYQISSGIGFTKDPYIAYTLFNKGFFVYRVWKDFQKSIEKLEHSPDLIIIENGNRQLLSDLGLENATIESVSLVVK
ncbi:Holliday junction resolvase RuvX [Fervidobacterium sp.]